MLRPPPASAVRLLHALLPRSIADDVTANLDDLHARRARQRGQLSANAWYWRQAFTLPVQLWLAPSITMTSILHDLRHAFRFHRAHPGPATVAILSLTLGIGLSTAIFSIVDGVLLRPAPVPSLDRLAMVWETDRATGTVREPGSLPDFLDFRSRTRSLDRLGAFIATEHILTTPSGEPTRLPALLVSPEMQEILGIRPLLGRPIAASDIAPPGKRVTLISESLWSREFNRNPSAVGSLIRVNNVGVEIIGVVPDRSDFGVLQILSGAAYSRAFADRGVPVRVDLWRPLTEDAKQLPRSTHPVLMVGRLEPGADVRRTQEELAGIAADLEQTYPQDNDQRGVMVEPLRAVVFGPIEPVFLALLGAVGLVLLVVCVNVASLLLAQQTGRRREVAVRMALGAGGGRLVRQYLTEAVALAAIGTTGGAAAAYGSLGWLISQAPAGIPRLTEARMDARVLVVTMAAGALVAVLFGLLPALQALDARPQAALASSGRSVTGVSRRLRRALVVCEIAMACVLVVGCGLLLKSFWRVYSIDLGFDRTGVVKAEFLLPAARYPMANFPQAPEVTRFVNGALD
jgi:predicted permease